MTFEWVGWRAAFMDWDRFFYFCGGPHDSLLFLGPLIVSWSVSPVAGS